MSLHDSMFDDLSDDSIDISDSESDEDDEQLFKLCLGWKDSSKDEKLQTYPEAQNCPGAGPVPDWVRCSPADLFFRPNPKVPCLICLTRVHMFSSIPQNPD